MIEIIVIIIVMSHVVSDPRLIYLDSFSWETNTRYLMKTWERKIKKIASFSIFQTDAITAAIIQCPNWQVEGPYSSLFSLFLLWLSYFSLPLFFPTTYNYLLHNGVVSSGRRKSIVAVGLFSAETLWQMYEGNSFGGEGTWVSLPDIPLPLVIDLATEWLCKRKIHICKREGISGMFITWLLSGN